MADQCFVGDGNAGVANAGPLPRVGGVTSQAGVAWTGGPETGLNIGDGGWHGTHVAAVAADAANGIVAVGEHCTLAFRQPADLLQSRPTEFRDQQRMHEELRAPLPEDRRLDLPKDGKHQASIMNWVKDIEAEAKTRGLDTMFHVDENIRNVGNHGHVARFVSIFTHFGKVSIKDTEDYVANIAAGGGVFDADAQEI